MRRRRGARLGDRRTVALAVAAAGLFAGSVILEVGRVWRRGPAPALADAEDPVSTATEVVVETAAVARTGYRLAPTLENALFNLLSSFVLSFIAARAITAILRTRRSLGPFRNVKLGRRHIHHFVPGIALAFTSGAASIISRKEGLDPWLALPFGAGMGLTFDESALLLELDDVYWSEEGVVSVQLTLAVIALLGAIAVGSRILRRGEEAVLESELPRVAPTG